MRVSFGWFSSVKGLGTMTTKDTTTDGGASDLDLVMEAARLWRRQHDGHWAGQFQAIRDTRAELEQAIRAYGEQRERKGRIETCESLLKDESSFDTEKGQPFVYVASVYIRRALAEAKSEVK